MDESEWYFTYDGQTFGPHDWTTMRGFAVHGHLLPSDLVWTEGWPQWFPAGEIEQLLPLPLNPLSPANQECYSSRPGKLALSRQMLLRFPEFVDPVARYQRCLALGDAQPAFVMQLAPLIVASNSDETDCIVLLRFDAIIATDLKLTLGARLLTTNFYDKAAKHEDIIQGPKSSGRWGSIYAMVADFLSADTDRVAAIKRSIPEPEWQLAWDRSLATLAKSIVLVREGSPFEPAIVKQ